MAFVDAGTLVTGTTTVQPGAPASIVAGNLLVACMTGHCTTQFTLSGSTTGWQLGPSASPGAVEQSEIWIKTAVGSDTMPTWNGASASQMAGIVSQWNVTTAWDNQDADTGTTSPLSVTMFGGIPPQYDRTPGDAIIVCRAVRASTACTITAETDNVNGLGVGTGINVLGTTASTSQASHHRSIYVTTAVTGQGVLDSVVSTWTLSTGTSGNAGLCILSLYNPLLVGLLPDLPIPFQARRRASIW